MAHMSPAGQDGRAIAVLLATRWGRPARCEQLPQTSHVGPSTSLSSSGGRPCPGQALAREALAQAASSRNCWDESARDHWQRDPAQ
eukprot:978712-Amphidinium_carterae.1